MPPLLAIYKNTMILLAFLLLVRQSVASKKFVFVAALIIALAGKFSKSRLRSDNVL